MSLKILRPMVFFGLLFSGVFGGVFEEAIKETSDSSNAWEAAAIAQSVPVKNPSPEIVLAFQYDGKGQDKMNHKYFDVRFRKLKKAVGYNLYFKKDCPYDTCPDNKSNFIPSAYRLSSVSAATCIGAYCSSIGNYTESGGTLFLKACAVFEGGKEECSEYKTFVYDGLNGAH